MTQTDKELLLKDLSARLSYGVCIHSYCSFDQDSVDTLYSLRKYNGEIRVNDLYYIEEVKPYLFPISSMTEEQKEEFNSRSLELQLKVIDEEIMYEEATEFEVDFYNKHHLDWRGLIPKGLALDATGKNIY